MGIINAVAKYGMLCLAAFSSAASAATGTSGNAASSCVSTTAAASTEAWAVDYAAATAPTTGTGYDVSSAFLAAYAFNSTMVRRILFSLGAIDSSPPYLAIGG